MDDDDDMSHNNSSSTRPETPHSPNIAENQSQDDIEVSILSPKETFEQYFTIDNEKIIVLVDKDHSGKSYKCTKCGRVNSCGHPYKRSNPNSHLKEKHPHLYEKIQNRESKNKKADPGAVSPFFLDTPKSPNLNGTEIDNIIAEIEKFDSETVIEIIKKLQLKLVEGSDFFFTKYTTWAIMGNWPDDISRRPEIIDILQTLFGRVNVPGKNIAKNMVVKRLDQLEKEKSDLIKETFESDVLLHPDADKWKSPWGYNYMGLNVSGISRDWKYFTVNVALEYFPGCHKAEDIKAKWISIFQKYGINIERIKYMYTDGEASMVSAVRLLRYTTTKTITTTSSNSRSTSIPTTTSTQITTTHQVQHFYCYNHLLNLVNQDVSHVPIRNLNTNSSTALSSTTVGKSGKKDGVVTAVAVTKKEPITAGMNFYQAAVHCAHTILAPFAVSPKKVDILRKLFEDKKLKPYSFIYDMETRWWIKCQMIERLLQILPVFNDMNSVNVVAILDIDRKYPDWEEAYNWYVKYMKIAETGKPSPLHQLIKLLKHGEIWSSIWEIRNHTIISLVYPGYKHLHDVWSLQSLQNEGYCSDVIEVGIALQKQLIIRFQPSFSDGLLYAAAFLDPLTYCTIVRPGEEVNVEKAMVYLTTHCIRRNFFPEAPQPINCDTEDVDAKSTGVFTKGYDKNQSKEMKTRMTIDTEYDLWKEAIQKVIPYDMYALDFYEKCDTRECKFPTYLKLAKDILGGKAGSSASESLFSIAKHGFPAHRSSTNPVYAGRRVEGRFNILTKKKIEESSLSSTEFYRKEIKEYTSKIARLLIHFKLISIERKKKLQYNVESGNVSTMVSSSLIISNEDIVLNTSSCTEEDQDDIGEIQEELIANGMIAYAPESNQMKFLKVEMEEADNETEMTDVEGNLSGIPPDGEETPDQNTTIITSTSVNPSKSNFNASSSSTVGRKRGLDEEI
jgi:hypothetical protein